MSTHLIRKKKKVEISIIPLVDVLIVLIFFFLMTMQFKDVATLNLTLPEIETAGNNTLDDNIIIEISKEGLFVVNGTKVTLENLEESLIQIKPVSAKLTVMIRADEEVVLKNLTEIMDACRKAGLDKIRLQSR